MPEHVELTKGDMLLFYTDGLTETRSPDMNYFEERLPDQARDAGWPVRRRGGRGHPGASGGLSACEMRDDLTVLALRVTDPPGES